MNEIEIILTKHEREELIKIPESIDRLEIIQNYALSEFELKLVRECRLAHNKIGFALQVGILKHKGYPLRSNTIIPKEILIFLGKQLNIKPKEFKQYFNRKQTVTNHFNKIKNEFQYTEFHNCSIDKYIKLLKIQIKKDEVPLTLIKYFIDCICAFFQKKIGITLKML